MNRTQRNIWDEFCAIEGNVYKGHDGAYACDHLNHFKEDLRMLKSFGFGAYRFSVSWSRFIDEGKDQSKNFYRELVDYLHELKLTPFLTLYHWDMPQVFQEEGGWKNPRSVDWFSEYTEQVLELLGERVKFWTSFNEPNIFVPYGFVTGKHAPGKKYKQETVLKILEHTLLAHKSARDLIKNKIPSAEVGIVMADTPFIPQTEEEQDAVYERYFNVVENPKASLESVWLKPAWWLDPLVLGVQPRSGLSLKFSQWKNETKNFEIDENILGAVANSVDFVGLNIYTGNVVKVLEEGLKCIPYCKDFPRSTMNWPINEKAMYWGVKFMAQRYKLPIYITENGISLNDRVDENALDEAQKVQDEQRIQYYALYLERLAQLIEEGVQVRGYFAWSLLDNFEWAFGYSKRFGLIYVDFETQKRIPKLSCHWFKESFKRGYFELEEDGEIPLKERREICQHV